MRHATRFANVLVDLDGTLTDPFAGIASCIRHAMVCMARECPSEAEMRRAIGPPLRQTFGRLLGTEDATRIDEAMRFYRERYAVTGLFENEVYPGLADLMSRLKLAGCRLFVATSKPNVYAKRILDHFGLTQYFAGIYGSELNGVRDHKRDLLGFLMVQEQLRADESVMVGDRGQDMLAAKAHRLAAVGVTWGYGSRQELSEAGADVLCTTPAEVFQFVTEFQARKIGK